MPENITLEAFVAEGHFVQVPLCSLTENFWREQPIAGGVRTFRPSTGLKLTAMGQILGLLGGADLPERVKQNAAAVLQRLGEVEAGIHQAAVERVHFHEVGAVDSICDIVGACLGLELLGVEAVYCSPLNLGSGTVASGHGRLPVPAAATAALLRGVPVYARGPEAELTTPTGRAPPPKTATSGGAPQFENTHAIAGHESRSTSKLYDRTRDDITLDEVERIAI